MTVDSATKSWKFHAGKILEKTGAFDIIECHVCGFKHIVPIPTPDELDHAYKHEYYTSAKPLYIERYKEDLDWWNMVYTRRYRILEKHLFEGQRRMLDIGSGPGYFLLNGKKRGWQVKGIEPSLQAAQHSKTLGIDVLNGFFSENTAKSLGEFDAVNLGEVLEHIDDPAALLSLVHRILSENGMVCIIVPNDFNPYQILLRDHLGFKPWWVAPPHHINYFSFESLSILVKRCGFEVVQKESTFPIDMFLLMGDNYIGNDDLGRKAHTRRMNFEKALIQGGKDELLDQIYASFSNLQLGREIVLFARKSTPGEENRMD